MPGSDKILINNPLLDSGNDGNGSGTDPTSGPGAVVDVDENAEVAVTLFVLPGASDPPADAATLDIKVQASDDGGSTWVELAGFRQILGSELADGVPVCLAVRVYSPTVQAAQSGIAQFRLNSAASTTTNWDVYSDIRTVQDIRQDWLNNAQIQTP